MWKTVRWFLKDLEIEIPFDPAIPLLGIYSKDYKSFYNKDTRTHVHCGTVYNRKDLEPTQMPISDRLDKENMAHIHHGILCSHKNDEFVSFVGTWMNLETIILSKLTQEQETKHWMFSLISGWWAMRIHGHREGNITHQGLLGGSGARRGIVRVGELGRDSIRRNSQFRWQVDSCRKPPWHMYTYVTNLHILYMYPRTYSLNKQTNKQTKNKKQRKLC